MGPADKDYFLDDEGKLTTDEEQAATLLIRKGQEIPKEMAERYFSKSKSAQTVSEDDSDEKASGPKSNKAATPKANKSGAKQDGTETSVS